MLASCPAPEVTVPSGARWLRERTHGWTESIEGVTQKTRRLYERRIRLASEHAERLGFPAPTRASDFTARMIEAIALDTRLSPGSRSSYLMPLRQWLDAEGNAIAKNRRLWRMVRPDPTRVDWLTADELARLYAAAEGRQRLVVALGGFNALRNGEIRALTYGHVRPSPTAPRLVFPGKRNRTRDIAMAAQVRDLLEEQGPHGPSERVYPLSETTLREDLYAVCRRAGIRQVGPHTLRRPWGRVAYYDAKVPLMAVRDVYGHQSVELTARYIGVHLAEMRLGMDSFSRRMAQISSEAA